MPETHEGFILNELRRLDQAVKGGKYGHGDDFDGEAFAEDVDEGLLDIAGWVTIDEPLTGKDKTCY